jgi:uncharacterized membrane protein
MVHLTVYEERAMTTRRRLMAISVTIGGFILLKSRLILARLVLAVHDADSVTSTAKQARWRHNIGGSSKGGHAHHGKLRCSAYSTRAPKGANRSEAPNPPHFARRVSLRSRRAYASTLAAVIILLPLALHTNRPPSTPPIGGVLGGPQTIAIWSLRSKRSPVPPSGGGQPSHRSLRAGRWQRPHVHRVSAVEPQ